MNTLESYPLVSIITVNYNQADHTLELLKSLKKIDYPNTEIIVVDNNSKKSPLHELKLNFPTAHFIQSHINLGFAGGNNLGIKKAKGEYIFLVNNDTEVKPDTLTQLIQFFQTESTAGICCPLILFHNSNDTIQYAGSTPIHPLSGRNSRIGFKEKDHGQFSHPYETAFAHGAAMMVRKSVIDQIGLMPEVYFLYYEELDWCESVKKLGYKIFVVPQAKIYHKESVSTGKDSALKTYYLTRNRLLFMRRNSKGLYKFIFVLFFTVFVVPKEYFKFIVHRRFKHIKEFNKALYWNLLHQKSGKKIL